MWNGETTVPVRGSGFLPYGLNDHDEVAGAINGSYASAALWEGGTVTWLADLGQGSSWAYDINENGQIVGQSKLSSGEYRAVLWTNN